MKLCLGCMLDRCCAFKFEEGLEVILRKGWGMLLSGTRLFTLEEWSLEFIIVKLDTEFIQRAACTQFI